MKIDEMNCKVIFFSSMMKKQFDFDNTLVKNLEIKFPKIYIAIDVYFLGFNTIGSYLERSRA